jgi:hypothetical protein
LAADYKAGERVIGPPGLPHTWKNPSDQDALHIVSEHRPVLHMELMLEVGSHIARDFSENKKAAFTHVLRAAVLLNDIKSDFYFTSWSRRALMAAFRTLAPLGKLLGYGSDPSNRPKGTIDRLSNVLESLHFGSGYDEDSPRQSRSSESSASPVSHMRLTRVDWIFAGQA